MREKVISRLKNVKELPSFPAVAHEVLSMVQRDDFSFKDLKNAIEKDPALAVKVLKVANSFAFNPYGKEITSLDRAIAQLGVRNLVPIVVGLSAIKLSEKVGGKFDKDLFWKHSYTCAHIARRLAKRFGLSDSEAFTAGLLHDVGKLVLYTLFPEEYEKALEIAEEKGLMSVDAEMEVFGIDHGEVGEIMTRLWKLPRLIGECTRFHHNPSQAQLYPKEAALIRVADLFSRATGAYFNRDSKGILITEDEGWKILSQGREDIEELLAPILDDVEDAIQFAEIAWGRV